MLGFVLLNTLSCFGFLLSPVGGWVCRSFFPGWRL